MVLLRAWEEKRSQMTCGWRVHLISWGDLLFLWRKAAFFPLCLQWEQRLQEAVTEIKPTMEPNCPECFSGMRWIRADYIQACNRSLREKQKNTVLYSDHGIFDFQTNYSDFHFETGARETIAKLSHLGCGKEWDAVRTCFPAPSLT